MSRSRPAPETRSSDDKPTAPALIAEGRAAPAMDVESAQAIADASKASGFPVPPQVKAVLDAADRPSPAETAPMAAQPEEH